MRNGTEEAHKQSLQKEKREKKRLLRVDAMRYAFKQPWTQES